MAVMHTTTLTTGAALLRAILTDPADDMPRIAYADWLEESGDGARAEFIRVQLALAAMGTVREPRADWVAREFGGMESVWSGSPRDVWDRYDSLRCRERGLLDAHRTNWFAFDGRRPWSDGHCDVVWMCGGDGRGGHYFGGKCHRGFVAEVRCTLADFVGGECVECQGSWDADDPRWRTGCPACSGSGRTPGHGAAIVAQQPVTRVEVTDRLSPWTEHPIGDRSGWFRDIGIESLGMDQWTLPPSVWDRLDGHAGCTSELKLWQGEDNIQSDDLATAALSLALVNHARQHAGLPPLPHSLCRAT